LAELLDIDDPTLFALPHTRGFSGGAWMKAPAFRHRSEDWTEPPRFFALPVDELGTAFAEFVGTNVVGASVLSDKPAPRLSEVVGSPAPLPARSAIRLEDGLAGRVIISAPDVPSVPHTDILAATVVEVSVKRSGFVFSATVFRSSGSKMADQTALDLARAIHFKPVMKTDTVSPSDPVALNWGRIVFQWLTVETPATNNPVAGAAP
jgi:TonB family protein